MGAVFSLLADVAGAASKALRNGPLVTAVGVPLTLGTIVGFATLPQVFTWYQKLNKPKWCPPAPLFGQTWSLLYGLMGYASYLVWQQTGWPSQPLTVYAVQLALNLAWQVMFFLGHKPKAALVENTALLGAVAYTTYAFWQVDPRAGQLMLPYLAFNGFAVALNKSFVDRNPQLDDNPDLKSAGPQPKAA
jgi:tryptophan-rich sensory protein